MKNYLSTHEIYDILEKKYPEKLLPFVGYEDVPNNWLKMHGYVMHRRKRRIKYIVSYAQ